MEKTENKLNTFDCVVVVYVKQIIHVQYVCCGACGLCGTCISVHCS